MEVEAKCACTRSKAKNAQDKIVREAGAMVQKATLCQSLPQTCRFHLLFRRLLGA